MSNQVVGIESAPKARGMLSKYASALKLCAIDFDTEASGFNFSISDRVIVLIHLFITDGPVLETFTTAITAVERQATQTEGLWA